MAYDYKKAFSVEGKKCIVTGGAQGLSKGMAEASFRKWRSRCPDGCPEGKAGNGNKRVQGNGI